MNKDFESEMDRHNERQLAKHGSGFDFFIVPEYVFFKCLEMKCLHMMEGGIVSRNLPANTC